MEKWMKKLTAIPFSVGCVQFILFKMWSFRGCLCFVSICSFGNYSAFTCASN